MHLKGLYCSKIVHIVAERAEGHRGGLGISCNCTQKLLYQRNRASSRGISLECGGVRTNEMEVDRYSG